MTKGQRLGPRLLAYGIYDNLGSHARQTSNRPNHLGHGKLRPRSAPRVPCQLRFLGRSTGDNDPGSTRETPPAMPQVRSSRRPRAQVTKSLQDKEIDTVGGDRLDQDASHRTRAWSVPALLGDGAWAPEELAGGPGDRLHRGHEGARYMSTRNHEAHRMGPKRRVTPRLHRR